MNVSIFEVGLKPPQKKPGFVFIQPQELVVVVARTGFFEGVYAVFFFVIERYVTNKLAFLHCFFLQAGKQIYHREMAGANNISGEP